MRWRTFVAKTILSLQLVSDDSIPRRDEDGNIAERNNERIEKNPKVSVIIPTYNRAAKVRNAIESVLAQTFSDFEVIVVDDGSSDDTGKILGEVFGDRIRYYFQTNQGAKRSAEQGNLTEAQGEWIAFLDSDDLWEKDKLEWQFKALEQFGPQCGACYTDVRFLNHPETRTMFQMAEESDSA